MKLSYRVAILFVIICGVSALAQQLSLSDLSGSGTALNFQASPNVIGKSGTSLSFDSSAGTPVVGPDLTSSLGATGNRAALARATLDYPVTPGDMYSLGFITAAGPVSESLVVGADYKIALPNMGSIDALGLSFVALKERVEELVLSAYPLSAPQLAIENCGVFPVYTQGEVKESSIVYCWGLSRLSSLLSGTTDYASDRSIVVRSKAGEERRYDLFKARRFGDLSQDPYLTPNDTVVFGRIDRLVRISGEVRRPGSYQLLPGEGLKELVELYGDGLGDYANSRRVLLLRHEEMAGLNPITPRDLDYAADSSLALLNGDEIFIEADHTPLPARSIQPFVSVTGAVKAPGQYAYVEGRGWEYYVALAGGIDSVKNSGERLTIFDASGARHAKGQSRSIQPEDRIVVDQNNFFYQFTQVAPIVTALCAIATVLVDVLPYIK